MAAKGAVLFDLAETLGAVFVDASGRIDSLEVYSHVPALLESLSKEGLALASRCEHASRPIRAG